MESNRNTPAASQWIMELDSKNQRLSCDHFGQQYTQNDHHSTYRQIDTIFHFPSSWQNGQPGHQQQWQQERQQNYQRNSRRNEKRQYRVGELSERPLFKIRRDREHFKIRRETSKNEEAKKPLNSHRGYHWSRNVFNSNCQNDKYDNNNNNNNNNVNQKYIENNSKVTKESVRKLRVFKNRKERRIFFQKLQKRRQQQQVPSNHRTKGRQNQQFLEQNRIHKDNIGMSLQFDDCFDRRPAIPLPSKPHKIINYRTISTSSFSSSSSSLSSSSSMSSPSYQSSSSTPLKPLGSPSLSPSQKLSSSSSSSVGSTLFFSSEIDRMLNNFEKFQVDSGKEWDWCCFKVKQFDDTCVDGLIDSLEKVNPIIEYVERSDCSNTHENVPSDFLPCVIIVVDWALKAVVKDSIGQEKPQCRGQDMGNKKNIHPVLGCFKGDISQLKAKVSEYYKGVIEDHFWRKIESQELNYLWDFPAGDITPVIKADVEVRVYNPRLNHLNNKEWAHVTIPVWTGDRFEYQ